MSIIRIDGNFDLVGASNSWEIHEYNSRTTKEGKPAAPKVTYFGKLESACASLRDAQARKCESLQEIIDLLNADSCICKINHKKGE